MSVSNRVRVREVRLLSDQHYVLKATTFDWLRNDGRWEAQTRETYDRGDGVVLLPFNRAQRSVILCRQFRYPAFVNGHDDLMVEAPAGLLDGEAPEARVRAEVEEEIGYRLGAVSKVLTCFMSPGAVTERLHCYVAEYDQGMRIADGGGRADEGEDIDVLEMPFAEAFAMVGGGGIVDAKTIILLQHLALTVFSG